MQKNLNKYFWDGIENFSEAYRVRRILEYASFPDLIKLPFKELKSNLPRINIDKLRTGEKRKTFLRLIKPLIEESETWDEVFSLIIDQVRENIRR